MATVEFEGREIPVTAAEMANPRRAALRIRDMQNDRAGSSSIKRDS